MLTILTVCYVEKNIIVHEKRSNKSLIKLNTTMLNIIMHCNTKLESTHKNSNQCQGLHLILQCLTLLSLTH